jgi:hypothetical protein
METVTPQFDLLSIKIQLMTNGRQQPKRGTAGAQH